MNEIVEDKKIKKRDIRIVEKEYGKLETLLKKNMNGENRRRKPFDYNAYKIIIVRNSIITWICFLLCLAFTILIMSQMYRVEEPKRSILSTILVVAGFVFPLLPNLGLAYKVFLDSEYGEMLFAKSNITKTLNQTQRRIDMCHHYCDLFIALHKDQDKAKHDYLVKKSQVYAKKALFNLLTLTNGFIATIRYRCLKYKDRKEIIKKVEDLLKNANGAIILSFKGRIPNYVNDSIERCGKNIVLIKGSEV